MDEEIHAYWRTRLDEAMREQDELSRHQRAEITRLQSRCQELATDFAMHRAAAAYDLREQCLAIATAHNKPGTRPQHQTVPLLQILQCLEQFSGGLVPPDVRHDKRVRQEDEDDSALVAAIANPTGPSPTPAFAIGAAAPSAAAILQQQQQQHRMVSSRRSAASPPPVSSGMPLPIQAHQPVPVALAATQQQIAHQAMGQPEAQGMQQQAHAVTHQVPVTAAIPAQVPAQVQAAAVQQPPQAALGFAVANAGVAAVAEPLPTSHAGGAAPAAQGGFIQQPTATAPSVSVPPRSTTASPPPAGASAFAGAHFTAPPPSAPTVALPQAAAVQGAQATHAPQQQQAVFGGNAAFGAMPQGAPAFVPAPAAAPVGAVPTTAQPQAQQQQHQQTQQAQPPQPQPTAQPFVTAAAESAFAQHAVPPAAAVFGHNSAFGVPTPTASPPPDRGAPSFAFGSQSPLAANNTVPPPPSAEEAEPVMGAGLHCGTNSGAAVTATSLSSEVVEAGTQLLQDTTAHADADASRAGQAGQPAAGRAPDGYVVPVTVEPHMKRLRDEDAAAGTTEFADDDEFDNGLSAMVQRGFFPPSVEQTLSGTLQQVKETLTRQPQQQPRQVPPPQAGSGQQTLQ